MIIEEDPADEGGIDTTVFLEEDDLLYPGDSADELAGEKLTDEHYHTVIDRSWGNVRVFKPNGDLLAVFLAGEIEEEVCVEAYKALRAAAQETGSGNRGMATGKNSRRRRVLEDGTVSKTNEVPQEIRPHTGIVGYFDRYPRIPYCRQTAYNINHPDRWESAVPFFQRADELFEQFVPDRYANQREVADRTVDDWLIPATAFTTVTVNLNWQTACHQDAGDLKEGFGVMPVIDMGHYEGAYFIQPKFGMAYDCRTTDLLLNDVHEWHGNGPFTGSSGYYERLSCVLYYRRKMEECDSPEEELERAKRIGDERALAGSSDTYAADEDALEQVTTTNPDEVE